MSFSVEVWYMQKRIPSRYQIPFQVLGSIFLWLNHIADGAGVEPATFMDLPLGLTITLYHLSYPSKNRCGVSPPTSCSLRSLAN